MSASLVGSEMCIRDRGARAAGSVQAAVPGAGTVLCSTAVRASSQGGSSCLLYTSDAADDM
eukprot:3839949-Alexandrium_andersonii.AAC.1